VPVPDITRKLDADFFHGRWARATDRQRELLQVVSILPNADQEFTVQEVVASSNNVLRKPFTSSHVNQMLSTLAAVGLVYKNRHGKYSLAVPLLGEFIQRQRSTDMLVRVE
jgi:DNA-binding IclR family transcriptional regulator